MKITPYESVGQIRFGMTNDEVTEVIGVPSTRSDSADDEYFLGYSHYSVCIAAGRVVEVGLCPESAASIEEIEVFSDPEAFGKLCELDGKPYESMGFIILLKLGITLTGFHDHDPSQLAMTAFCRGRWDRCRPVLTPFVTGRGSGGS